MGQAVNQNTLCYGDNLDILRRQVEDESVDVICFGLRDTRIRLWSSIMPMRKRVRSGPSPSAQALLNRLVDEWQQPTPGAPQPIILEESGARVSRCM